MEKTSHLSDVAKSGISAAPSDPSDAGLHNSIDDVIAVYKRDVDRTMLRDNLRLSVTQRMERFEQSAQQFAEIYEAGRRHRGET